jgi:hypothetical protein
MMGATALIRMQQDAFNDLRIDIVRFHVFNRAYGIKAGLYGDAALDDRADAFVLTLL